MLTLLDNLEFMMPKNPAAVSLGRKGGQSTSERKRQASKANALKASQAAKAKRDAVSNRNCLGCGNLVPLGTGHHVDGVSVQDTAGTRRTLPRIWHDSCWQAAVAFNEDSRVKYEAEFAARAAAALAKLQLP